ncbi:MAG TPA: hypothetical protein VF775_04890 [Geobacteraceae bacterium]
MQSNKYVGFGILLLGVYILGGIVTFSGLFLVGFMSGQQLLGWGDGRSIGYLFICVGLCLSLAGVLFMKTLSARSCS